MPIPDLTADGLLPSGLHDCTFDEILARFGRSPGSSRRDDLCRRLDDMLHEVWLSPLFEAVLVDGSFVTSKPEPDDIDLILITRAGHDWSASLRPFEYNLLSRRRARRLLGFDVWPVEVGTAAYLDAIEFFEQVRSRPGLRKGLLKVSR